MFNQYIWILVWIGFMALLQGKFYRKEYSKLTGEYEWRVKPFFAFMVMAPVVWMASKRGGLADTYAYLLAYRSMPTSIIKIPVYLSTISKDKGFYLFSSILKTILGRNEIFYLLVIASIQAYAVGKLYRKYSINFVLSVFLFIASTDYISWMFNGIRQFMAVAIIILGTPLMIRRTRRPLTRKYIPVCIVIILASTMHQSALLMLPFIFIAQGKAWNKKTVTFMIIALLAITSVGSFTNLLNTALSETQYVNVVSDYTAWNDDGTNPIRVFIYSIPAVLAFWRRNKIRKEGNVVINFCTNMSIVSMGLYLISMVTSGIFIGRLPIYCSLYGYILLPWEINNFFGKTTAKIIKILMILGYICFYFYGMHYQNGLI